MIAKVQLDNTDQIHSLHQQRNGRKLVIISSIVLGVIILYIGYLSYSIKVGWWMMAIL